MEKVEYVEEPRCKKCGKPVRYQEQEFCYDCQKRNFAFEQGKSVWIHQGAVKWSIYQYKYHDKRIFGKFYAQEMIRLYGSWIKENQIDLIVPVPLHRKRKRMRGYNQAEILADYLSEMTGIPVEKNMLLRHKYTEPQKQLGNKERKKNLKNSFSLEKEVISAKNILIVDDIYTTGSTIDEIANTIRVKFTSKVWFLTISIGQGF